MKEIKLPSGNVLQMGHTPFSESKALYQALLEEAKGVQFDSKQDFAAVIKDMFCAGFSSKKIEACLEVCLKRCLYAGLKIENLDKMFDSKESRQDYSVICIEVVQENIGPFTKGLYAEFVRLMSILPSAQP